MKFAELLPHLDERQRRLVLAAGCWAGRGRVVARVAHRVSPDVVADLLAGPNCAALGLGGFDLLAGHGDSGGAGGWVPSWPSYAATPRRRSTRSSCAAQVDPVLGRTVVELEQHVETTGDLRYGFGILCAVVSVERFHRQLRLADILGQVSCTSTPSSRRSAPISQPCDFRPGRPSSPVGTISPGGIVRVSCRNQTRNVPTSVQMACVR